MRHIHIETEIKMTWDIDTDKELVQTPAQLKENLIKELMEDLENPKVEVKAFSVSDDGKRIEV